MKTDVFSRSGRRSFGPACGVLKGTYLSSACKKALKFGVKSAVLCSCVRRSMSPIVSSACVAMCVSLSGNRISRTAMIFLTVVARALFYALFHALGKTTFNTAL